MARYTKNIPMVDSQANSFAKVQQYLQSQKFKYRTRDGEQVFQKGDGVWVAAKFIKVTYYNNIVRLEAWVDAMGAEQDLEGFVASAAKKPLKKAVAQVEQILCQPNPYYGPQEPAEAVAGEGSICAKCGAQIVAGGRFCPVCAHQVGMPVEPGASVQLPEGITKKEYFKHYAGESFYRDIKIASIIAYICAGISAVVALLVNPWGLIDAVILLALALGVHIGKSKGCAIAMLAYSIFSVLLGLIVNGTLGGWLWIAAGATAVIAFANAEKRYKQLTNK